MMTDAHEWKTCLTDVRAGSIRVRGYPIEELMGNVSFSDAIYLIFRGELPDSTAASVMQAILVASIDHGGGSPSALTARTVASAGAPIGNAAAAGLLAISRFHGAVIEACMRDLLEVNEAATTGQDMLDVAAKVVRDRRDRGVRLSGFGHRLHAVDPRPQRLFDICHNVGLDLKGYEQVARAVESAVSAAVAKNVPLNLDGAIAVALLSLEFPPEVANPLFTIGRFVGLNAQAWEECTRMPPMRAIFPRSYVYDGPPPRHLPDVERSGA